MLMWSPTQGPYDADEVTFDLAQRTGLTIRWLLDRVRRRLYSYGDLGNAMRPGYNFDAHSYCYLVSCYTGCTSGEVQYAATVLPSCSGT